MSEKDAPLARALRAPWVHFVLLGGLLFAVDAVRSADADSAQPRGPQPIVVTADHVAELTEALRRSGEAPTPARVQAEVDRFVDEEAMVREARRLGLDRGDLIIRRRLVQKMSFVVDDMARAEPPTEAELADWLAAHRDRYRVPARYDVEHVYFAHERRGAAAADDAAAALAGWRDTQAAPTGDPFLGGQRLARRTEVQLARAFGADFAAAVAQAPVDDGWHGPVASSFGQHLLRVTAVAPAFDPTLDAVRVRVRGDLLEERRRKAAGEARARLRANHPVVVEQAP